jgi:AraC-like DNA-binding protein
VRYQEFTPSEQIGNLVARLWTMTVENDVTLDAQHRVVPDGCVDLVVMKKHESPVTMTVRGPRLTPLFVPVSRGDRFWGARLWPDVGGLIVGVTSETLVERMYPGSMFFGLDASRLGLALAATTRDEAIPLAWEAWFEPRVAALSAIDPKVRLSIVALNAVHGALGIERLAAMVSLSARQLQRRFRRATGLTVKSYARIRRFRQSLTHLLDRETATWSAVANRLGFADQSHLISEFTRLAGARPSEIAAYVKAFQHIDVRP